MSRCRCGCGRPVIALIPYRQYRPECRERRRAAQKIARTIEAKFLAAKQAIRVQAFRGARDEVA